MRSSIFLFCSLFSYVSHIFFQSFSKHRRTKVDLVKRSAQRVLDRCDRCTCSQETPSVRERTVQTLGSQTGVQVMNKVQDLMTEVHRNVGARTTSTAPCGSTSQRWTLRSSSAWTIALHSAGKNMGGQAAQTLEGSFSAVSIPISGSLNYSKY